MKRSIGLLGALALTASTLVGCTSGGSKETSGIKPDEAATLKVMYYDEGQFFQDYGNMFLAKFPNVEIEVLSMNELYRDGYNDETLGKFIQEKQPDLLMIDDYQFEKFVQEGKLLELDALMQKDGYNAEGLYPGMLDYIRSKGGGKLYALTNRFHSQALYYNKDLFDQHGVPYPTDQMTWPQVLDLAKRFPTDGDEKSRIYGLYQDYYDQSLLNFSMEIGRNQGLSFVDPETMTMTLDTESWKTVFDAAISTMKSGVMYRPNREQEMNGPMGMSYEEHIMRQLFVAGRAAMSIEGPYLMEQIRQAKDHIATYTPPNWDLVTVPVNPNEPDSSASVNLSQLFGIRADSLNTKVAWEFIQYITGDEYAKIMSRSNMYGNMLVRTAYIKDKEGKSLEAFYKLKPASNNMYSGYDKLPPEFYGEFMNFAETELQKVYDGTISVSEALQKLQAEGQTILLKHKDKAPSDSSTEQQPAESTSEVITETVETPAGG